MAKCKVLAFLLCENAIRTRDGKVALQGLFDRMIAPRNPRGAQIFFVYYKLVVMEPCTVTLRVFHVDHPISEIDGHWRDSLSQLGPVQGIWALTTSLFKRPGNYALKLEQVVEDAEPVILADTLMVLDQGEK